MNYTANQIIARRKELWEESRDIEKDREFTQSTAEYIVSEEGEAIRQEIKEDSDLLIEMAFVVVNKQKKTVPFFLNDVQRSFADDLKQAIADFKAGRRLHLKFIILKGRQQGFTSYITAHQLAESITQRNWAGFTLADNAENTETVFTDKAKYPYDNLADNLKPQEKYNTRRELHFEKLNSRWRVATAGSKDIGRSKTLNAFHGSEAAFWSDLDLILGGLGEALTSDSIQILESTANGPGEFKNLWDGAVAGNSNWEPKFYEWWRTPEYRLGFETPEIEAEFKAKILDKDLVAQREKDCFDEIRWLQARKLDWQQLYWYYNKWKDNRLVKQEYPNTPEQAFTAGEGIAFPEFSLDIHVCDDFQTGPPAHWRKWRAVDNGYADPFAWYWFTVSEDGQVFIYREFTREPEEPKIIYSDQAREVKKLSTYYDIETGDETQERIGFTVAGHDAWATHVRDQTGKTLIDYYRDGGVTGFIEAITDRRLRKSVWHEYLKPYWDEMAGRWIAKVQICKSCRKLIETLPQLMKDEKDAEKVAECAIDHPYDGAGYGLIAYHAKQSAPLPEEQPLVKKVKSQIAKKVKVHRKKLT